MKAEEKYLEMAKQAVMKKQFTNYYTVECEDANEFQSYILVPLSDKEVEELKTALENPEIRELYNLEEFGDLYAGYYELYEKLCGGTGLLPIDIFLDQPDSGMVATMVVQKSVDSEPIKFQFAMEISKDDYTLLLAWYLQNKGRSLNFLLYDYPDLFYKLSNTIIMRTGCSFCGYIIFLDEIEKDAAECLAQQNK